MSQVLISMGEATAPRSGQAQVYPPNMRSAEITSSATSQAAGLSARYGEICRVINNGTDTIWVTFAASPVAAVLTTHAIAPNTASDFGPMEAGFDVAVINDS